MKKVVFSDKRSFVITQSEFEEAYIEWKKKKEFFCKRLDSLIPPFYLYVCPLHENLEWEHRVMPKAEDTPLAYSKKRKQIWYVEGQPYEKLLKSITGEETFEGVFPKRLEIVEPVDEKIEAILKKTMLIDDFIDMKYKK